MSPIRFTATSACWNCCHRPTKRSIGWETRLANIWKATSPGDELADLLDPVQPGDQHPRLAVLEVRHRQAQEVPEHRLPEHRVDAVPGMEDEILPHPGHDCGKEHEHDERRPHHPERALRLVHDDLVDHDLREKRRRERDELDRKRGREHVAPDALVLQELGDEPPEAESRPGEGKVRIGGLRLRPRDEEHLRLEAGFEFLERKLAGRVAAGFEKKNALRRSLDDERRPGGRGFGRLSFGLEERNAGERQRRQLARAYRFFAGLEFERLERAEDGGPVVGGRKLLQQQRGIEGQPV
jgi:hypothetical protein